MIIRPRPHGFCCLTQHHHAQMARQLAAHWPLHRFPNPARRDEVLLAIGEHDRGWIPLDARPCWNEQRQAPFSFLDYPTMPRLRHYQQGIREVAALSPYAGLLCSLHYSRLPQLAATGAGAAFGRQEQQRQRQLRQQLHLNRAEQAGLAFHLELLQFCDGLSLHVCLSDPATALAAAYPATWPCAPAPDDTAGLPPLRTAWLDHQTVRLHQSPFEQPLAVRLHYAELSHESIRARGLSAGYRRAPVRQQTVNLM